MSAKQVSATCRPAKRSSGWHARRRLVVSSLDLIDRCSREPGLGIRRLHVQDGIEIGESEIELMGMLTDHGAQQERGRWGCRVIQPGSQDRLRLAEKPWISFRS